MHSMHTGPGDDYAPLVERSFIAPSLVPRIKK